MSITITGNQTAGNQPLNDKSALLADMIAFNQQFNSYLECNDSSGNCSDSYKAILQNNLQQSADNIMLFGAYSPKIANPTYDSSLNYITSTYNNNVLALRQELDEKMKELNNSQSSIQAEDKYRYDVTIYAGILWTVLATSTIYYVFSRL
jgi:hypothetical protein